MTIFQFHIVRLKDAGVALQVFPHTFQFHIVRLKAVHLRIGICLRVISIPYSSIKRKTEENGTENGNVFQFHIVRLKERSGVRQAEREEFQFHIVRLKERT